MTTVKKLFAAALSAAVLVSSFAGVTAFADDSTTQYGVTTATKTDTDGHTVITQTSTSKENTSGGSWFYIGKVDTDNLASVTVTIGAGSGGSNVTGGAEQSFSDETTGTILSTDYDTLFNAMAFVTYSSTTDARPDLDITSSVRAKADSDGTCCLYAWVNNGGITITVTATYGITTETELQSLISAGGSGTIAADFDVDNTGVEGSASTATVTITGGNHTLTKPSKNASTSKAMLYQNNASSWTISSLTLDGNKSNVTHTDACIWHMAGTATYNNVTFQHFKTSDTDQGVLTAASDADDTSVYANVTLNSCMFTDNEGGTQSADVYVRGNGTVTLEGTTTAAVYYAGGTINISGLTDGCAVTITASDEDNYGTIAALNAPTDTSVTVIKNASTKTITIASGASLEAAEWTTVDGDTYPDGYTASGNVLTYNNTTSFYAYKAEFSDLGDGTYTTAKVYDSTGVQHGSDMTVSSTISGGAVVFYIVTDKDAADATMTLE